MTLNNSLPELKSARRFHTAGALQLYTVQPSKGNAYMMSNQRKPAKNPNTFSGSCTLKMRLHVLDHTLCEVIRIP